MERMKTGAMRRFGRWAGYGTRKEPTDDEGPAKTKPRDRHSRPKKTWLSLATKPLSMALKVALSKFLDESEMKAEVTMEDGMLRIKDCCVKLDVLEQ